MIEKYMDDSTLDADQMLTDVNDTLDGFERDIARVDTHMEYARRKLRRQRNKYNKALHRYNEAMHRYREATHRLNADRSQRVRDLAAFKANVVTDLVKLRTAMTERLSQQADYADSTCALFSSPRS